MKRFSAILVALILLCTFAILPAGAAGSYSVILDDSAGLLQESEAAMLTAKLQTLSDTCSCNIAFVTVTDLSGAAFSHNGTTEDYADRYYETAFGMNTDGIVVLEVLSNENGERRMHISTSGKCISRLTDEEREAIFDDLQYNHNPDFHGFYDLFDAAADGLMKAVPPHLAWYMLPLAILIGFGVAMIVMLILRGQLKSVRMARGAVNYVRAGSMQVTASRDTYLYSTISRTAKPKNTSGSSVHTSSGGGSHGGGGRSF